MEKSENFEFNLPSRDSNDIVDVNLISDNFRKIDKELKDAVDLGCDLSGVAPSITNTIIGGEKSLTVNNVSPISHNCSCKLTSDSGESRNIYKFDSENMKISFNENTLSKTYNDNGTITLNGYTNTGISVEFYFRNLTVGETYTFSLKPYGVMFVQAHNENHEPLGEPIIAENDVVTFTHTEDVDYYFAASNAFGAMEDDPFVNLTFYPQLELGTVATEWTQYGGNSYIEDFSTVKVNVNGAEYIPNADGTVTDIASVSPTMEITTDNEYVNICDFTYCVDTKKYVDDAVASSGGTGGGSSEDIIDKIIDPDNNPLSESTETIVNFVMETGALDSTGADTESSKQIRSDFISLSSSSGAIYASTEWNEDLRIIGYDENKAFVEKIYASVGGEFSIPETWAYLRFYTGATDAQFTFVYGTPETKAEFKKVYIRDHGYYLKGENISEPDSHKLVIQTSGLDGNPYNITEIRAPSSDPKEATLCLTNWGNGVNQMVDISSMAYDPENPTMEIVCQARNGSPLPEFSVRYNDGSEAGRVKKFTVHPDAIPIELTAQGLKVRKNNTFDNNGTEEDYVVVNLAQAVETLAYIMENYATKEDVNGLIGEIETALGGI